MVCKTIREILANAGKRFGDGDAIRYKKKKDEIETKSYTQLKEDSERFSAVLGELEDEFDIEVNEQEAVEIRTVGEAVSYVEKLIGS